jgi:hypothetical protein
MLLMGLLERNATNKGAQMSKNDMHFSQILINDLTRVTGGADGTTTWGAIRNMMSGRGGYWGGYGSSGQGSQSGQGSRNGNGG